MPNNLDLVPSKYLYIYTLLMMRVRAILGTNLIYHTCCVANLYMQLAWWGDKIVDEYFDILGMYVKVRTYDKH